MCSNVLVRAVVCWCRVCVCLFFLSVVRGSGKRGLGVWFGTCECKTWDCACVCVSEALAKGGTGTTGPPSLPPSPDLNAAPHRMRIFAFAFAFACGIPTLGYFYAHANCTRTCRMPVAATGLALDLDWYDRTRTLSNVGSGTARASHDLTARCGEGRRLGRWCMRKPWHGVFVPTIFEARLADALEHRAEPT